MNPHYPEIEVQLSGEDGNAFFIIARVRSALRKSGISQSEIEAFTSEASGGNYDNVLQTCMRWVSVA